MTPSRGTRGSDVEAKEPVSELTTGRLSIYLRCLSRLEDAGVRTVSSKELARRFHLNSAQIRKDLACLGEFGIRGVGYEVRELREHLVRALGIDRPRKLVIVGAGNLGMALADYGGFNADGFRVVAMFDSDPSRVGLNTRSGIVVRAASELPGFATEAKIDVGIIAVPAEAAQQVCDTMVAGGIAAILNFAPAVIRAHGHVKIRNVDLRISLESLSFYLKNSESNPPDAFPRST